MSKIVLKFNLINDLNHNLKEIDWGITCVQSHLRGKNLLT